MPSSTSSSERLVPEHPWGRVAALAAVLLVVLLGAWEMTARAMGYAPSYNDTPELWARSRREVRAAGDDAVVIVGASRIRFDLDHAQVAAAFGGAPVVNLSMFGSVARPVLEDLAADPGFRGTVLCGYTATLFWVPGGPLLEKTLEWVAHPARETLARRAGQLLAMGPETFLAFLNKEDLSMGAVLKRAPIADRPGTQLPPRLPPYMARVDADRRARMWSRLEQDEAMQREIQQIWLGILTMSRPLPPPLLDALTGGVVASVRAIEARGGRVIFLEFPVTGPYREHEEQVYPPATHWERLLRETGCAGVSFRDDAELASFDCPEWSHLTEADAERYTRRLLEVMGERGLLRR